MATVLFGSFNILAAVVAWRLLTVAHVLPEVLTFADAEGNIGNVLCPPGGDLSSCNAELAESYAATFLQMESSVLLEYYDDELKLPEKSIKWPSYEGGDFLAVTALEGITNPSLLILPGGKEVLGAFRALKRSFQPSAEGIDDFWYSAVLLGSTPIASLHEDNSTWNWTFWEQLHDSRFTDGGTQDLVECYGDRELNPQMPGWNFMAAQGNEDPTLFSFSGKTYIMFIGKDVVRATQNSSKMGRRPDCGAFGQQPRVAELLHESNSVVMGPVINLRVEQAGPVEKNWSPFSRISNDDAGEEQLFAVYSIHPHVILNVSLTTGKAFKQYNTTSSLIEEHAISTNTPPHRYHGGSNVVMIPANSSQRKEDYYLSLCHYLTEDPDHGEYYNYPYRFSASPPFEILEVGKELTVLRKENGIQFVSSLNLLSDTDEVVLGYNTGEEHSNIFRMSLRNFEDAFFS